MFKALIAAAVDVWGIAIGVAAAALVIFTIVYNIIRHKRGGNSCDCSAAGRGGCTQCPYSSSCDGLTCREDKDKIAEKDVENTRGFRVDEDIEIDGDAPAPAGTDGVGGVQGDGTETGGNGAENEKVGASVDKKGRRS